MDCHFLTGLSNKSSHQLGVRYLIRKSNWDEVKDRQHCCRQVASLFLFGGIYLFPEENLPSLSYLYCLFFCFLNHTATKFVPFWRNMSVSFIDQTIYLFFYLGWFWEQVIVPVQEKMVSLKQIRWCRNRISLYNGSYKYPNNFIIVLKSLTVLNNRLLGLFLRQHPFFPSICIIYFNPTYLLSLVF